MSTPSTINFCAQTLYKVKVVQLCVNNISLSANEMLNKKFATRIGSFQFGEIPKICMQSGWQIRQEIGMENTVYHISTQISINHILYNLTLMYFCLSKYVIMYSPACDTNYTFAYWGRGYRNTIHHIFGLLNLPVCSACLQILGITPNSIAMSRWELNVSSW